MTDAIELLLSLINLGCLTLLYLAVALKLSAPMTLLVLAMGGALMLLQRASLGKMRASGRGALRERRRSVCGDRRASAEPEEREDVQRRGAGCADVRATCATRWRATPRQNCAAPGGVAIPV